MTILNQDKIDHLLNTSLSNIKLAMANEPENHFIKDYSFTFIRFLIAIEYNNKAINILINNNFIYSGISNIINRSSLEILFNTILIMSKPDKYNLHYYKAGWRQEYEKLEKYKNRDFFKNSQIDWLKDKIKNLESSAIQIDITQEEKLNIKKQIKYFPTVPQMIFPNGAYFPDFDRYSQKFLTILHDEFYCRYSEILHAFGLGLSWLVTPYFDLEFPEEAKLLMISEARVVSIVCLLSLMTEINLFFKYGFNNELKNIWENISKSAPIYNDIYNAKYSKLL